ncbi:cysteine--tRNA ligase, cytoplasmic isoform X2 [Lycorma delicatula]
MAKRTQPHWWVENDSPESHLKLYNSFTRQKEIFIPKNGRKVIWYSCGPTVYDASHMGHARSYITFDILRRVLSDYFGYHVFFVMNVTDIDDKIIKRARQNYLFEQYLLKHKNLSDTLSDAKQAMLILTAKTKTVEDPDQKMMLLKLVDRMSTAIKGLEDAVKSNDNTKMEMAKMALLEEARDPISDWLDKQFGSSITDNSIFSELPRHWEKEFRKDIKALNIQEPNVWCRVSEYIPEIINYIKKIIDNGYAYEANGSVYFDVLAFDKKPDHHYAKLVPEAFGDGKSLMTGEGDLISGENHKKNPTDFALWKKSKPGEPFWNSPWGHGRPGWHIECSAMASDICGSTLDIHTGGVDLRFPHHDNELAQAEAYFDHDQWVRYFLHSGHLTIAGCKMSKSLKNFITISDALKKHTARQLRLAFLLHSWKDTLDYSDSTMDMAISYERMLNEFFLNVKDIVRTKKSMSKDGHIDVADWKKPEMDLEKKFDRMVNAVHTALCDNIDTRTVLDVIRESVSACNLYIRASQGHLNANAKLLEDIALYITKIMKIFGAIQGTVDGEIGFPVSCSNLNNINNMEGIVMPYINILSEFRDNVRTQARQSKAFSILKLCDQLRDDILPGVGVRLEDAEEGHPTHVKLVDKDQLMKEREAKIKAEQEKAAERERKRKEQEELIAQREAQRKIPPDQFFHNQTDKYSQFDDQGVPTHDADGKELSKGQYKKLQKQWQLQEKKYTEYLQSISNQNGTS